MTSTTTLRHTARKTRTQKVASFSEENLIRDVPASERFWNVVGCVLLLPCLVVWLVNDFYPMTLDLLTSIAAAEYNRHVNRRRREKAKAFMSLPLIRSSTESSPPKNQTYHIQSVAAVVGYREDPEIFEKALESYKSAHGCAFVLVSVDGEDEKDLEMVNVFNKACRVPLLFFFHYRNAGFINADKTKVFPQRSATLRVCEPMGEIASRIYQKEFEDIKIPCLEAKSKFCRKIAIDYCCNLARQMLSNHNIDQSKGGNINRLCLYQRHMHKKGIMFTSFIFSIVICELLDIEFLWSSDSDTYVFPNSLEQTMATIAGDESIGGASSGLAVHNTDRSLSTKLGSAIYWSELYTSRSLPASLGSSDCQSGPSAAFRVKLVGDILLPWYNQKVCGRRMIINEDRHLTTNLIARGWKIAFASDVLAGTETPETVASWIGQQVRWARAAHIESFQQPWIYVLSHPVLFWTAVKREIGPLLAFIAVILYAMTGRRLSFSSRNDLLLRAATSFIYNYARNPDRSIRNAKRWAFPGLLFYNIPLPAIQAWSLVTVLSQGWMTSMRAQSERGSASAFRRRVSDRIFLVIWMGIVGAAVGRSVPEFVKSFHAEAHVPTGSVMLISGVSSCLITWYIMIGCYGSSNHRALATLPVPTFVLPDVLSFS